MTRDSADVVVIGGGSTGTSIAWQLAQRGAGKVVLLDGRGVASGATKWSSAQIRQHYTNEVLSRMALRAVEFFENFEARTGEPGTFNQTGLMVLVAPQDVEALSFNIEMQRSLGIDSTLVDVDTVAQIDPRMATDDVVRAGWEPRSGYCDPVQITNAYAAAARRNGAEIREASPVSRLIVEHDRIVGVEVDGAILATGSVVLATGFRTNELTAPFGIELPLTPIRHSVCVIEHPDQFGDQHPIVSDRIAGSYYRPTGATRTLIGTTAAEEGVIDPEVEIEKKPSAADADELTRRAIARFPLLQGARLVDSHTGVYDCTPDVQPILGWHDGIDGLHFAAGMSGHGFKLAPIVAEMVACDVLGESHPEFDIDFFALSRFQQGRAIASPRPYSVGTLG
jgi:sarcosine oxidase subunit beta